MTILPKTKVYWSLVLAQALILACGEKNAANFDLSGDTLGAVASALSGGVTSTAADSTSRGSGETLRTNCPTMLNNYPGTDCLNGTDKVSLIFPETGCTYPLATLPAPSLWSGQGVTAVASANAYGGSELTVTGVGSGSLNCTSGFPAALDPTNFVTLRRTFLGSTNSADDSPNTATFRVNHSGTESVVVDSTNLRGWSYTPTSGGYLRTYSSATAHLLSIGIHQIAYVGDISSLRTAPVKWNYTLSTQDAEGTDHPIRIDMTSGVSVPGSSAVTATQHAIASGILYVQGNSGNYTGTATLIDVIYFPTQNCCFPYAGKIKVKFSGGTNDGQVETLDFGSSGTACQSATYGQVSFTNAAGSASTKTLTHCL